MEKYKKKIKKRLMVLVLGIFIFGTLMIISFIRFKSMSGGDPYHDFIAGYQFGLFWTWLLLMIWGIVRDIRSLRNEEICKKQYIKENDERTLLIQSKAQAAGFWITISGILIATVIAGFYSITVFSVLYGVCIFMAVVSAGVKIYYRMTL